LSFEEVGAAREFSRKHRLDDAQPVQRLAPYMMSLLSRPAPQLAEWAKRRGAYWYLSRVARFTEN